MLILLFRLLSPLHNGTGQRCANSGSPDGEPLRLRLRLDKVQRAKLLKNDSPLGEQLTNGATGASCHNHIISHNMYYRKGFR